MIEKLQTILKSLSFSWIAIFIVAFFVVDRHLQYELWNKADGVIDSDAKAYYAYLPAYFIEDDLSFSFLNEKPELEANYWLNQFGETRLVKMTAGLSLLSAPFFVAAHTLWPGDTGFEPQYKVTLIIVALFYLFIGLIALRKLLLSYVSELAAAVTIIVIGMGTNLWYYSIQEVFMSHVFSFSLISWFLLHTLRPTAKYKGYTFWIWFGVLLGFITLVRPTNGLILLVPMIYKIESIKTIITNNWKAIAVGVAVAIIVWLPQLAYWKTFTDSWFFFSYGEEGFNFLDPHVIDGLFSFRKGFFVYTPLMLLMLPGLYFLRKANKTLFVGFIVFFILNTYVMFSWWCWWYGGSFGSRPMIDTYALYALPIALLLNEAFKKKYWLYLPLIVVLFGGIQLNRFQTQQYRWKIIHWDSMTKEAYFFTLFENPEAPEVGKYLDKPGY